MALTMSARRQSSTTSLSQFARTGSPTAQRGSIDFCNSFWGFKDQGFDVLSRRMRGAIHTTEELRNYWKERAAIEEDYAKRLSKLSRLPLGKDEVGDLRRSLDTVRDESDKQATFHLTLAQQIRNELETPCAEFQSKQLQHKKGALASIEKQCKAKQLQETHVEKAREKYEQDCIRINSYTAQSSLVQGKDLEKIQLKLERARQSVQANERDFVNFTKAIESTVQKWEQDWKAFCDSCQDLEEARLDFMKDNLWSYANLVSTVCVADDESCERVRVSLELMETDREIEHFVTVYGTGAQIPDPPSFVNYQLPDATPSSSSQSTFRFASFARSSSRDIPLQLHRSSTYIPVQPDDELMNTAGRGAGGASRRDTFSENNLARQSTQRNSAYGAQPQPQPYLNGSSTGPSLSSQIYSAINAIPSSLSSPVTPASNVPPQRRPTNAAPSSSQPSLYRSPPAAHDPLAEPIDPTAETYMKVGNHAYKVDPTRDPQVNSTPSGNGPTNQMPGSFSPVAKQNGVDPLQKQLEELQNVVSTSGSSRRNTTFRGQATNSPASAGPSGSNGAGPSHTKGADSLSVSHPHASPPHASPSPGASGTKDYRNSAELVVGAPPVVRSRSSSPNPPVANFMVPKNPIVPSGSEVVQEVLADYHQSFPGERKVTSGSGSRRSSYISQQMQSPPQPSTSPSGYGHGHSMSVSSQSGSGLAGPPNAGHAGIGAHGGQSGSNSPQPPLSRGPSPAPGEISNTNHAIGQSASPQPQPQQPYQQSPPQQRQQPQSQQPSAPPQQQQQQQRRNSAYMTPPSSTPVRAASPNPVGIALDPSGRVSHDEMAQRYQMQQQQQRGQTPLSQPYGTAPQQQQQYQQQQQARRSSYLGGVPAPGAPGPSMAPPGQPMYSPVTPPPPPPQVMNMYQQAPPSAQAPPPQGYMPSGPGQQQMYAQYPQQVPPPQQQLTTYGLSNGQQQQQQRVVSGNGGGYAPPPNQIPTSLVVRGGTGNGYRSASPVGRSPSPQPMAQQVQQQPQVQQMPQSLQVGHQMQQMQQPPPQPPQQQPMHTQAQGRFGQQPLPQQGGQMTENGQPIMFYVKALYDYQATIDEEFDFQTGDIIAVTSTPEDGWWSGELLDETRRQRGRHIFPSNFVCLF